MAYKSPVFPNPSKSGEYWDAYAGEHAMVPPPTAAAIGHELLGLCELQSSEAQPFCIPYVFRSQDGKSDDYTTFEFRLSPNKNSPGLFSKNGVYDAIIDDLSVTLRYVKALQKVTELAYQSLFVNVINPGHMIAQHRDSLGRSIVALNVAGTAFVTIADTGAEKYSFEVGVGNGFVVHNSNDQLKRPAHSVTAGATQRIALVV